MSTAPFALATEGPQEFKRFQAPDQFHSPADTFDKLGRPLMSVAPSGSIPSIVVRKSDASGDLPMGCPEVPVLNEIMVDPGVPGREGFKVNLGAIPPAAMQAAIDSISPLLPGGGGQKLGLETRRDLGYATLKAFADQQNAGMAIPATLPLPANNAERYGIQYARPARDGFVVGNYAGVSDVKTASTPAPQAQQTVMQTGQFNLGPSPVAPSPLASQPSLLPPVPVLPAQPAYAPVQFEPPHALSPQLSSGFYAPVDQLKAPPLSSANTFAAPQVGPPEIRVKIRVEGFPFEQEAFYHAVSKQRQQLILTLDHRYKGMSSVFPAPLGPETKAVVTVFTEAGQHNFLTLVTGIRFTHEQFEHCVLGIIGEG